MGATNSLCVLFLPSNPQGPGDRCTDIMKESFLFDRKLTNLPSKRAVSLKHTGVHTPVTCPPCVSHYKNIAPNGKQLILLVKVGHYSTLFGFKLLKRA
jgi:hypothetical protein